MNEFIHTQDIFRFLILSASRNCVKNNVKSAESLYELKRQADFSRVNKALDSLL